MAIGGTAYTLANLANELGPDGKHGKVLQVMSEKNEIVQDGLFLEANDTTSHLSILQASLPTVAWRLLNYGIAKSKAVGKPVRDTMGSLEGYSEIDKDIADMNGEARLVRGNQARNFLESMTQELARCTFYGNESTDPKEFTGLAARFSALADNVISGGGASNDNTSMWFINWGADRVHYIYPRGSKAGLSTEDKGQVTLHDASNNPYEGYRTHFQWKVGIAVPDSRHVVRVCNIDVTKLLKDASSDSADLVDLWQQALNAIEGLDNVVAYMRRKTMGFLQRQLHNHANMTLTWETIGHRRLPNLNGIPIRRVDQITEAEATIS